MSAADQLSQMLSQGRAHDALLNNNSAAANYVSANNYYDAVMSDNPSAEEPNDWAKILMSLSNQNNLWSADQAQKQMDFQERMSNTAHQREIADLKAAGLNPVLSARLGGATTPVGAQGTTDTSIVGSIVSLMDKMLDVETDNAKLNLTRELAAASGAGVAEQSNGILAAILDLIPGVSSKNANAAAAQITDAYNNSSDNSYVKKVVKTGTNFINWLFTGKTSSGSKNNYQTPQGGR